jgi:DNA-binding transcriptional LysR family regulator
MQVTGAAIAAGLGLGVLPERAARLFPPLRPLSPIVAHGTGWLIVHPDLRQVPRVRAVVDTLAEIYRAESVTARGLGSRRAAELSPTRGERGI